MKQGVLVYDQKSERMDVRFGLEDYYGGLHCGTCMDVFVNNRWKPTRIEYGWDERGWYLIAKQTVEHILGIERHKRVEEKKQQKEEQR